MLKERARRRVSRSKAGPPKSDEQIYYSTRSSNVTDSAFGCGLKNGNRDKTWDLGAVLFSAS